MENASEAPPVTNYWNQVQDFDWVRAGPSPHWSVLKSEDGRAVDAASWQRIRGSQVADLGVEERLRAAKITWWQPGNALNSVARGCWGNLQWTRSCIFTNCRKQSLSFSRLCPIHGLKYSPYLCHTNVDRGVWLWRTEEAWGNHISVLLRSWWGRTWFFVDYRWSMASW